MGQYGELQCIFFMIKQERSFYFDKLNYASTKSRLNSSGNLRISKYKLPFPEEFWQLYLSRLSSTNVTRQSSDIFSSLRKSSEIIGNFRKNGRIGCHSYTRLRSTLINRQIIKPSSGPKFLGVVFVFVRNVEFISKQPCQFFVFTLLSF